MEECKVKVVFLVDILTLVLEEGGNGNENNTI